MKIQIDWPQYFIEPHVEATLLRNVGTRFKSNDLVRVKSVEREVVIVLPFKATDSIPSQEAVDRQLEKMVNWVEEPLKQVEEYLNNRTLLTRFKRFDDEMAKLEAEITGNIWLPELLKAIAQKPISPKPLAPNLRLANTGKKR